MDLPNDDHVLRHVPYKKLAKDSDGNIVGLLNIAFELRSDENDLSVTWVEYSDSVLWGDKILDAIGACSAARKPGSNSRYAVCKVGTVLDLCASQDHNKVKIVHNPTRNNPAHSSIIRLPDNDYELMDLLAEQSWVDLIPPP